MIRSAPRRLVLAGAVASLLLAALGADWRSPPPGEGPEVIPVRTIDGHGYVRANDLARTLDATKFWRADVRRLVLRAGTHTMIFTVDNPFVVVDESTFWLEAPVRSRQGEIQVPVALMDSLPSDSTMARLTYDARRQRVVVLPATGSVGSPRVTVSEDRTRIVFPAQSADAAVIVTRARGHFRLRFGGVFLGLLPDSFPPGSLVRSMRPLGTAAGSAFELAVDPAAVGFRLDRDVDGGRVTLELSREPGRELESFAPEDPPGQRRLRLVVIDPGHGGADAGVVAGQVAEKDLTLALARQLKAQIERRGIRVVLTRDDDRDVTAEARAELANRLDADLVIGLHFDGYVNPRARGATAYCPPATFQARQGAEALDGGSRLVLLPWRDVAVRHAVQSRALAEAVLSSLELRGLGPTRLREQLPVDLLGVNAPGILLECATLTASADRERVTQEAGLEQLAATLADGVTAYQRNE